MNIRDIVDVSKIVEIMEAWSTACNMATICLDADGEYITEQIGFTDFCMKYTRMSEEGKKRCKYCDRHNDGVYYCHAGLMDFGFNIVLENGEVLGRIIGGQVLPKPIEDEKIVALAKELDIPADEYLEAVHKIPIRDEKSIKSSAFLLDKMINYLVNTEYTKSLQSTYIKELEEVSNARLENQAKSRFLSHMSHDIRTPLNGIIGLTNIMQSQLEGNDSFSNYISKVSLLSTQLLSLMNDVLDMSQIESGKTELVHETFDIHEILNEIAPGLDVVAEEKGVRLTGAHYDIEHAFLVGSPIHLQRILMNIITNSLKYNKVNGTSECWLREIPLDHTHSMYEFTIKDTGIGMSKEFLKHIYEPFEVENTNFTNVSTGLGMSITKKYVDLMGGTIDIQSEKNVGTTVRVSIPFEIVKQMPWRHEAAKSEGLQGIRVLLVEDNEINSDIMKYMLENCEAEVMVAHNGKEAFEIVQKKADCFDVVLMDIMMPVMNGLEATRAIRQLKDEKTANIPIIAMTANAFQEDVRQCIEAGMNAHIAKPINREEVIQKILGVSPR